MSDGTQRVSPEQLQAVLLHINDFGYLASQPIVDAMVSRFPDTDTAAGPAGLRLRALLLALIERLKPASEFDITISEWRQYVILTDRYVRHRPLWEIQDKLSLGERQMRREHQRALQALSMLVQARLEQPAAREQPAELLAEAVQRLMPSPCVFGMAALLDDIAHIIARTRANDPAGGVNGAAAALRVRVEPAALKVYADRGILHQLMLKLAQLLMWNADLAIAGGGGGGADSSPIVSAELLDDRARVTYSGAPFPDEAAHGEHYQLCQWLAESLGIPLERTADGVAFWLPAGAQAHKVLILDDEPSALELFQSYLSGLNFDVVTESKPESVLHNVVAIQPDLVVLDVMMPAMDGWEVLQRLRHMPVMRDVPIVACSVLNDAALAQALGAARFLKKPILRQQLIRTLNELLGAARQP